MLTALSIRDVVLIDRLDLSFGPGLTVLTGETGAGKSILLDSLGLALGVRAEIGSRSGRLRPGQRRRVLFADPPIIRRWRCWPSKGLEAEDEIVLRRLVTKDGRSARSSTISPPGVAFLRRIGALLVEVQGQHDQMGLADPASHTTLLDMFGVPTECRDAVAGGLARVAAGRAPPGRGACRDRGRAPR